MQLKHATGGCLLVFWAIFSLVSLWLLANSRWVLFDPDGQLSKASLNATFDDEVQQSFDARFTDVSNSVFHLTEKECTCSDYPASHIRQINQLVSAHQFRVETLELSQFPDIARWVPSIPAIVVFDRQGQLAYLGPYSTGPVCTSNGSAVNAILKSVLQQQPLGSYVMSDGKGCYCHT